MRRSSQRLADDLERAGFKAKFPEGDFIAAGWFSGGWTYGRADVFKAMREIHERQGRPKLAICKCGALLCPTLLKLEEISN